MQLAIQKSVDRLISIASGDFARSTGRQVFKVITDGLLINIQQAVHNAAEAQSRPLSKLAQKRLMVWVLVDSLRSPLVLSGAAADRAGGRIWKQAERHHLPAPCVLGCSAADIRVGLCVSPPC